MFLNPWEGTNYRHGIDNQKVMLFGESHYDEEPFGEEDSESNYTVGVVNDILKTEKRVRFFEYVGRLFNDDWTRTWRQVAFANLVQFVLKRGEQPNHIHIASITAFYRYLEILKPDKAIVCSSRAWFNWFPKYIDDIDGVSLNESFRLGKSFVFKYPHSEGSTMVIGINHSSSRESDYIQTWKPVVKQFIDYKQ